MNIWSMSGAELSREIDQPAPVTVLRGGHAAPDLAGVLAQIAALPGKDQEALLRAFQAALKPEPKRLGSGNTFKDADSFFVAFNVARDAARTAAGAAWYLDPAVCLKARVPAAWVALRGEQGIWRSPRDINVPRGEYWPAGVLPTGAEYAEHGPVCAVGGAWEARAKPKRKAIAFDLEPTPEDIDIREAA